MGGKEVVQGGDVGAAWGLYRLGVGGLRGFCAVGDVCLCARWVVTSLTLRACQQWRQETLTRDGGPPGARVVVEKLHRGQRVGVVPFGVGGEKVRGWWHGFIEQARLKQCDAEAVRVKDTHTEAPQPPPPPSPLCKHHQLQAVLLDAPLHCRHLLGVPLVLRVHDQVGAGGGVEWGGLGLGLEKWSGLGWVSEWSREWFWSRWEQRVDSPIVPQVDARDGAGQDLNEVAWGGVGWVGGCWWVSVRWVSVGQSANERARPGVEDSPHPSPPPGQTQQQKPPRRAHLRPGRGRTARGSW